MSRPCPRSLRPVVLQDLPWRGTWWQSSDWQGEAADLGGLRLYPLLLLPSLLGQAQTPVDADRALCPPSPCSSLWELLCLISLPESPLTPLTHPPFSPSASARGTPALSGWNGALAD